MNILAFDTSSPVLSVALKTRTGSIQETKLVGFFKHAEKILVLIDSLMKKSKIRLSEIDTFLIGCGPGSFTGLRVGFATLKGFLAVNKKPCFGALSLDMIAENIELKAPAFLAVCLDARRGKIFSRFYERSKDHWVPLAKPGVATWEEMIQKMPAEIYVAGDAITRYGEVMKSSSHRIKVHLLPEKTWYPRAACLIRWFQSKNQKLKRMKTPKEFLPLYFRLSEAEEYRKNLETHVSAH